MVTLDFKKRDPIYRQIAEQIKKMIAANQLKPGDMLPSVRKLAIELDIDPNTVQRAYLNLRFEGWIDTVRGKGCFVCNPLTNCNIGFQAEYREDDRYERIHKNGT